jgi:hypothetical protein
LNCGELFFPHPSTRHHQRYCSGPACQRARKAKNNRDWRERNPDYFKDAMHSARVKAWRKQNPGYWRREKRNGGAGRTAVPPLRRTSVALQAVPASESVDQQLDRLKLEVDALQAVLDWQSLTFQGLAVYLTGSALQAELATVLASWYDKGMRLGCVRRGEAAVNPAETGGEYETDETATAPRAPPQKTDPGTIQLGGPASGP